MKKKVYEQPEVKVVVMDGETILAGSNTTPQVTNAWENNEDEENW